VISRTGSGADQGIIKKSGAWYAFASERIGQGRENVREYLKENPEITRAIETQVCEKFGLLALEAGAKGA
jgi:recombination protein RecA